MISLHEHANRIGNLSLFRNLPDYLFFAWVIPASVLVFGFFIFLIPFFTKLERQISFLLLASALIYLLGAVGCEMVGSYAVINSMETFYRFASTLEETLEMSGAILLFHVITSVALHKYKELVQNYFNELKDKCLQYKIDYVPVDIHQGYNEVLTAYIIGRKNNK